MVLAPYLQTWHEENLALVCPHRVYNINQQTEVYITIEEFMGTLLMHTANDVNMSNVAGCILVNP